MMRPNRGAIRHVRAMAAAVACVTTAFCAHIVSGGQTSGIVVLAVFTVSGALAWLLAAARLNIGQLVGLLVLCQLAVHGVSMMSQTGHPASMGGAMVITHGLATALSVALLARGESFVWAVAHHLALRPALLLLNIWRQPPSSLAVVATPAVRGHGVVASGIAPVRGPPTGRFALVAHAS